MKKWLCVLFLVSLILLAKTSPTLAATNGVIIGLNQFDPYFSHPHPTPVPGQPDWGIEERIQAKQWHYRLPFYAKILGDNSVEIRDDNQATFDKEIQFASAMGIDYWSIMYATWAGKTLETALEHPANHSMKYYLSSSFKNSLKFTVTLGGFPLNLHGNDIASWDNQVIPQLVALMQKPQYMKANGRPLLYIYGAADLQTAFGSDQAVKAALMRLRSSTQQAGLQNPYIVLFANQGAESKTLNQGGDAIAFYYNPTNPAAPVMSQFNGTNPWPYSKIIEANLGGWNRLANLRVPFVPTVDTGFDYRPNCPDLNNCVYKKSPIFEKPTPSEFAQNLSNAINWVKNHPVNDPMHLLYIYSAQEYPEGGWLTPTIYEGDAREQAVSKVLKGTYFSSPRFKGRDINGDKKIDINDYNRLVADFGKAMDPIQLNSDINANGKVDIFDYNILYENYGK